MSRREAMPEPPPSRARARHFPDQRLKRQRAQGEAHAVEGERPDVLHAEPLGHERPRPR